MHFTGNQVSWQGVNDLSAHPAPTGAPYDDNSVILNALGDLTNRENRFAYQRFSNDFLEPDQAPCRPATACPTTSTATTCPTIIPTLYPTVLTPVTNPQLIYEPIPANPPRDRGDGLSLRLPGCLLHRPRP